MNCICAVTVSRSIVRHLHPNSNIFVADDSPAKLQAEILQHVLQYTAGYIWQRKGFQLLLSSEHRPPWEQQTPCLWGCVDFGDNIQDEWFITSLLLDITKHYDVAARVWDNDGDFIMIEAAYALPRWLKPKTSAHRVWLYEGTLHILDPSIHRLESTPTIQQCLEALQSKDISSAATPEIVKSLESRLQGLPKTAQQHMMHRARAILPKKIAYVLSKEPQTIAAAVEAFYCRTPDDVRAATRMTHAPPRDMIEVNVLMSRCLYAQTKLQDYCPPKGWPMSMPSETAFDAAELGCKIVAGFEMLLSHAESSLENVCDKKGWLEYEQKLIALGYFKTVLRGSVEYKILEEKARMQFQCGSSFETSPSTSAALVKTLLSSENVDDSGFPTNLSPPDDDSWLLSANDDECAITLELNQREKEIELAASLRSKIENFMDSKFSVGGVETCGFNTSTFFEELQNVLGKADIGDAFCSTSEEGSSFYEGSADDWEAATETDSDDDQNKDGEGFREAYDEVLVQELRGTKMCQSFARVGGDERGVVDVDANLMQNLVASQKEQGGLPGPASNLLGMLDIKLPHGVGARNAAPPQPSS